MTNRIRFTAHALERYIERYDHFDSVKDLDDLAHKEDDYLDREIRRRGSWWVGEEETEEGEVERTYYCLVNNFKIYVGKMTPKGDMVLVTTYKYSKDFRGKSNVHLERRKDLDEYFSLANRPKS